MASSAMERCSNCGKPITEVRASVDGDETRWLHVVMKDSKVVTNQIQELCYTSKPSTQDNIASPPTITEAEARMHLDELDDLFREF